MLSIIIININSPPLSLSSVLNNPKKKDGKWTEKKNLWPFECRENWKKFCMFYVPLQSLACHKNLLFVVFLTHSLSRSFTRFYAHLSSLSFFFRKEQQLLCSFCEHFCFWFCVGSFLVNTFYYTRPFFCVKKVTIVKSGRNVSREKLIK